MAKIHRSGDDPIELADRLEQLAADLRRLSAGRQPNPVELAAAPVLDKWELAPFACAALRGEVEGHPVLGSRWILTSPLYAMDEHQRWARTLSRFYLLGRRAGEEHLGRG
jgi:hypothetical protein